MTFEFGVFTEANFYNLRDCIDLLSTLRLSTGFCGCSSSVSQLSCPSNRLMRYSLLAHELDAVEKHIAKGRRCIDLVGICAVITSSTGNTYFRADISSTLILVL